MQRHVKGERTSDKSIEEKTKNYTQRLGTIINHGFTSLGVALGHNVGLFDILRESDYPLSSQEVADAKNLKERYVRELLGSMVAAELVFITNDNKYYIPKDVSMDSKNLQIFSMAIPALAKKINDITMCFQKNGPKGFDYSSQEDILIMLEEEKQQYTGQWLDQNLVPPASIKEKSDIKTILDIGCGTGRTTINIAKHFPNAHVTGIDVTEFAIDNANKAKTTEGIRNVDFFKIGVEALSDEWNDKFDWIAAVEVLHDIPDIESSVKGIKRVLKVDGVLSVIDPLVHSDHKDNIGLEAAAAMLSSSCYCCLPCSLSCEPAVGNGVGLGVENRAKILKRHGFTIIGDELTGLIHCKKA